MGYIRDTGKLLDVPDYAPHELRKVIDGERLVGLGVDRGDVIARLQGPRLLQLAVQAKVSSVNVNRAVHQCVASSLLGLDRAARLIFRELPTTSNFLGLLVV